MISVLTIILGDNITFTLWWGLSRVALPPEVTHLNIPSVGMEQDRSSGMSDSRIYSPTTAWYCLLKVARRLLQKWETLHSSCRDSFCPYLSDWIYCHIPQSVFLGKSQVSLPNDLLEAGYSLLRMIQIQLYLITPGGKELTPYKTFRGNNRAPCGSQIHSVHWWCIVNLVLAILFINLMYAYCFCVYLTNIFSLIVVWKWWVQGLENAS